MTKLAILVVLACLFCRWAFGRWPWALLGPAPGRAGAMARARRLLGVKVGAGREEIIAAHRRLTTHVHPDKGGSTAAMQEANAARDLLLGELPTGEAAPPGDGDKR